MKVKPQAAVPAKRMSKEQAGRLLTLAYFLKTQVPEEQFDQNSYCMIKTGNNPLIKPTCGTSACALGWATVAFPDKFEMQPLDKGDLRCDGTMYLDVLDAITGEVMEGDHESITEFFGLNLNEPEHPDFESEGWQLFGTDPMTPKQKAKQIEALVKKHGYTYG